MPLGQHSRTAPSKYRTSVRPFLNGPITAPALARRSPTGFSFDALSEGRKKPVIRLQRHPLIFRFSPGDPGLALSSQRGTSTSSSHVDHETQPLSLQYSFVNGSACSYSRPQLGVSLTFVKYACQEVISRIHLKISFSQRIAVQILPLFGLKA